jgi:hypothetical protein
MSEKRKNDCYFNNQMIVKIELEENGHVCKDWKISKEMTIFGFKIKPRRVESYFRGKSYSDFDLFNNEEKEFRIDENEQIITKPSVVIQYLGGWQNRIEKFFDTYEEAKKYSQEMLTKENTTWENIEY